jgi:acetyl esterase/lipase
MTAMLAGAVALTACGSDRRPGADSALAALGDSANVSARVDSAGATPMQATPAPEQQAVLDELGTLGGKPVETLSAPEARQQPTPTDAVKSLLKKQGKPTTPEAVGSVVNRTIPGPGGALPVRIYTPSGAGPFPVIVYYHGGGFVIATIDTYDASARGLANAAGAVVVSLEYRKAPEHKFPAAHEDAYAAYQWALANAASIKGDPARVALAGESAGGNLALATAMTAREKGTTMPVAILAVYPVAGNDTNTVSYRENANAKPLSRPMMSWFFKQYTNSPADAQDPRLNILGADLKGLPPTTIVTAQIDPLRSEGEMLAQRLKDAGVTVQYRNFDGVAHEFFGQGAVLPQARDAVQFAAEGLKAGFGR